MQRSKEIKKGLLKTLAYSDIFDYPLTDREVWKYLISDTEVTAEVVQKNLKILADSKRIYADRELFFLNDRKELVDLRKERGKWSKEKLEIAQTTARKLSWFPWIKTLGVTGALAMGNCEESDDIDLLTITAEDRLWLTRLIVYTLAPVLGIKRRKPKEKAVKDKVCFNLFLDEDHLKIQPENLFLAHEICQVKPIFDRDGIYEKFMRKNEWVKKYLPNAVSINNVTIEQCNNRHFIASLLHCFIAIFDRILFYLQYQYMKSKITNEKVSLHQAFFHPMNLQDKITTELRKRLKTLDKESDLTL